MCQCSAVFYLYGMTGIFVAWSDGPNSPGWIEDGTGCHIWIGARDGRKGYAYGWDGERVRPVYRIRYEREIGPIPDGLVLDHLCNRGTDGCCNPRHCRPATHRQNVLRGDTVTGRNARKLRCDKGHPLSGINLQRDGRGYRQCRECAKASNIERARIPDPLLLDWLRWLAVSLGHTPTAKDVLSQLPVAPEAYARRFGSLTAASEIVGLTPNTRGGVPGGKPRARHLPPDFASGNDGLRSFDSATSLAEARYETEWAEYRQRLG